MRIMGLDFGSKTVGVAISDELIQITLQNKTCSNPIDMLFPVFASDSGFHHSPVGRNSSKPLVPHLILKDISAREDTEALYEVVADETELDAVAAVFENILGDVVIFSLETFSFSFFFNQFFLHILNSTRRVSPHEAYGAGSSRCMSRQTSDCGRNL